jgi:YggT family protein
MAPSRPPRFRRVPTTGAIYNPRQGQVKNGEIAGFFAAFLQGTSLVCARWNRYLADGPIRGLSYRASPTMRALLDIVLIVLDLYVWLLIAAAILSWLIAFNVVNTRNQFVAAVAEFLYRITEPLLAPIRSFLPNFGGLDISPIILILIIMFIQRVITYYIYPSVF